ncbi:MATE family efflux transporter [Salsuginibacillus kocurii]|uniref:MATE family efflux transporter n=1 Tax=Salsuginibacillus kocurii TaxID=427078 RepID=UPI0003765C78|nr:MATE family efflux transporter [Salsuginibacillus kocurii]
MGEASAKKVTHKQYLYLAIPLILATLSTPLLGAVDTAVVGFLADPAYLAGVAVGTLIFNILYWLFGFLRVSTSGYTAQAVGAGEEREVLLNFVRPALMAASVGLVFVALQWPIREVAMFVIQPPENVMQQGSAYFDIRIWGAPFALLNFVILGWLIGQSKVRFALFLQFGCNLLNMGLDVYFVYAFEMGAAGIGLATLLSEVLAVVIGFLFMLKYTHLHGEFFKDKAVFSVQPMVHMWKVNKNLFIRTVCLLSVFVIFTSIGASMGEAVIAANAILLQLHFIMAYFFDGLANASSILAGKAAGAQDKKLFKRTISIGCFWAASLAVLLTVAMAAGGSSFISLFTNIAEVHTTAVAYIGWIVLFPLTGFLGLQLYGFYTGTTQAAPVRNSLLISLLIFLLAVGFTVPIWGNHGLWFSFILFTVARSLTLWAFFPKLKRTVFYEQQEKIREVI